MTFTTVVMQCDGRITDRNELTLDRVQKEEIGKRLLTAFDMMLEEQLPQLASGPIKLQFPIASSGRLEGIYSQADLYSATAFFLIEKKLRFLYFFYTGHHPVPDAAAVLATEKCLQGMIAKREVDPGPSLRSLLERPLSVCVPWPPSASESDQRIVSNCGTCLAAAFFLKMTDLHQRSDSLAERN